MPVHRHAHRMRGSVFASKAELDAWQRERAAAGARGRGSGVLAETSAARSIAVLPFANLSDESEGEYFADGLVDEITSTLAGLRSLRVVSRTSTAMLKGVTKDACSIGRELGCRFLLEGSVRRAGSRLRITAQLVLAGSDSQVWAETFDGSIAEVFAIQERIARATAEALRVRLTTEEDLLLATRPIGDVHAYECYLRARHQGWRWRKDSIDQAIQLLRNGIAIVGDNARLYAALGVAYLQYREAGVAFDPARLAAAESCARKVLKLEGESAAGLKLMGWLHYARAEIQAAVHDLSAALRLEPSDPDTLLLLGNCYLISGAIAAATPLVDRLVMLDPLTPLTQCMPAWTAMASGDFASALGPYERMFEMDAGNPMARLFYVLVLLYNGREARAREIGEGFAADLADTLPAHIAALLTSRSDAEAGETALPPLPHAMEVAAAASDVLSRMLACAYARHGDVDRAMWWLETAVERGFINYPFLSEHDPLLSSLRREARFRGLMSVVQTRYEQFEA